MSCIHKKVQKSRSFQPLHSHFISQLLWVALLWIGRASPIEDGEKRGWKKIPFLKFFPSISFSKKLISNFFPKITTGAIVFFSSHLFADAIKDKQFEEKMYNLSICSIFKNESKFLKEWIEYHRLVGVDHFYLYNNNSSDAFMNVLKPYVKEGLVTLTHWPDVLGSIEEDQIYKWALSTQISAYENAIHVKGKTETKWLVCMNIDEFLVSPCEQNLTELLGQYEEYPGVILKSDAFDACQAYVVPIRKLIIQAVDMIASPPKNPHREVSKVIFKPELCGGFTWPPYQCFFKDNQMPIVLRKCELKINYYANRFSGYWAFGNKRDKLQIDNRLFSENEIAQLLDLGYEIEDQERPIYKFVPELMKRLGYDSWSPW